MLKSVLPQLLVSVVTAIVTAGFTLYTVHLTGRRQQKAEENKFKRQKSSEQEKLKIDQLEELYLIFSKWNADLAVLGHLFFQACIGGSLEQHPFLTADKHKLSESDYLFQLLMMVNLRFPELKKNFNDILETREKLMSLFDKALSPKQTVDLAQFLDTLHDQSNSFKDNLVTLTQNS